jgi:hypothetical protein
VIENRECAHVLRPFKVARFLCDPVQSRYFDRDRRSLVAADALCTRRTVLAILGLSPIGNALIIPLEDRFLPWDAARGAPDGIIVLGGAIDAWGPRNERLVVVPELLRRYPNARILFSGGSGALIDDGNAEAKFAARLLDSLGIARSRITLEDRSRNTVENAVFSKAIVQPKPGERWLLVTSAYHMPRAISDDGDKDVAKYFVPVTAIRDFIPVEFKP